MAIVPPESTLEAGSLTAHKVAIKSLSRREEQVLSLAAAGFLDKQIGPELGVSLNTLRTYWTRIRGKLGDGTRSALAVGYVEHMSAMGDSNIGEADWEIDLERNMWRKLSDRPLPIESELGEERPLDAVLAFFHPDDEPGIREILRRVRDDGSSAFSYTARIVTPAGPGIA